MKSTSTIATILFCIVSQCRGFGIARPSTNYQQSSIRPSATELHFFGNLGDAFKNDDSLGKPQNAGLKNGPNYNDNVTVNGKPVKGAVAGQKLTVVAGRVSAVVCFRFQMLRIDIPGSHIVMFRLE